MKRLEPLAQRTSVIGGDHPLATSANNNSAAAPKEDALVVAMLSRSRGAESSPTSVRASQIFAAGSPSGAPPLGYRGRESSSLAASQDQAQLGTSSSGMRRHNPYQQRNGGTPAGSPVGLTGQSTSGGGHLLAQSQEPGLSRSGTAVAEGATDVRESTKVVPPRSDLLPRATVMDATELDEMQSEGDNDDDENNHSVPLPIVAGGTSSAPKMQQQDHDSLFGSSVFGMPPDELHDELPGASNSTRPATSPMPLPLMNHNGKPSSTQQAQSSHHQQQQPQQPRTSPQPTQKHGRGWEPLPVTAQDLEAMVASAKQERAASSQSNSAGGVDVPCPAGFTITVYSENVSQHYHVASEDIRITQGAIKYVDHHARFGPQTRFRFQLCHNYLTCKCPRRSDCSYIHAARLPPATEVHLNPYVSWRPSARRRDDKKEVSAPSFQDDPAVAETYETLQPGTILIVHAPNAGAKEAPTQSAARAEHAGSIPSTTRQVQYVPSHMIIYTLGADAALRYVREQGSRAEGSTESANVPGRNPRHCAHYQFKRVCNLGRQCLFIHSKVPFAEGGFTTIEEAAACLHGAAPAVAAAGNMRSGNGAFRPPSAPQQSAYSAQRQPHARSTTSHQHHQHHLHTMAMAPPPLAPWVPQQAYTNEHLAHQHYAAAAAYSAAMQGAMLQGVVWPQYVPADHPTGVALGGNPTTIASPATDGVRGGR